MNSAENKKQKVAVGMSGGVDSSVAAYLLKQQGYDVVGVTMEIWPKDADFEEQNGGCCGLDAVEDAKRVAWALDIPHYVMNLRDVFKEKVIDDFISEYKRGNTPNPCIRCNRFVKWEAFLQRSMSIGADYIATGHYAKIKKLENGRYAVAKSVTDKKDQTYALYNLTQFQLEHTLFPIGEYSKDNIRDIAKKLGLAVANKPDSQEICFIPDNDYGAFLDSRGQMPGDGNFVDKTGNVLGRHSGIHHFTIGQRKGMNIAFGKPMYVCEIRPDTNEVVVGDNDDVFTDELTCKGINHMAVTNIAQCEKLTAKIRYGSKEYGCTAEYLGDGYMRCRFSERVRAITPGQAIVFYQDDLVLGGGTITRG